MREAAKIKLNYFLNDSAIKFEGGGRGYGLIGTGIKIFFLVFFAASLLHDLILKYIRARSADIF